MTARVHASDARTARHRRRATRWHRWRLRRLSAAVSRHKAAVPYPPPAPRRYLGPTPDPAVGRMLLEADRAVEPDLAIGPYIDPDA